MDYDSVAALHAFSLGAAYTIDPHGLWFTARPDGKYPTEFATPDEMRAETTWRYDNSPRSFSVTFRGERVTSFTLPGGA